MTERTYSSFRDIAEGVYAATNPVDWIVKPGALISPVIKLGHWRGYIEVHPTFGGVLWPEVYVHFGEHEGSFLALNPFGHASALLRIFRRKFEAADEARIRILAAGLGIDQQ